MDALTDEPPELIASLIRDHRAIEEFSSDARQAIIAAAATPDDTGNATRALESLRDLEAFLVVDVAIHIAKEEQVLFPAVRERAQETIEVIEDLLAQHDEVRAKHAQLSRVLATLDDHHDEVTNEAATLSARLNGAGNAPSADDLHALRDAVDRLDWIFQGHFLDEEDNLFEFAGEWFSDEELHEMSDRMARIEADLS